jgi:hypothetical protein
MSLRDCGFVGLETDSPSCSCAAHPYCHCLLHPHCLPRSLLHPLLPHRNDSNVAGRLEITPAIFRCEKCRRSCDISLSSHIFLLPFYTKQQHHNPSFHPIPSCRTLLFRILYRTSSIPSTTASFLWRIYATGHIGE